MGAMIDVLSRTAQVAEQNALYVASLEARGALDPFGPCEEIGA